VIIIIEDNVDGIIIEEANTIIMITEAVIEEEEVNLVIMTTNISVKTRLKHRKSQNINKNLKKNLNQNPRKNLSLPSSQLNKTLSLTRISPGILILMLLQRRKQGRRTKLECLSQ
jgi:hypothetical protein